MITQRSTVAWVAVGVLMGLGIGLLSVLPQRNKLNREIAVYADEHRAVLANFKTLTAEYDRTRQAQSALEEAVSTAQVRAQELKKLFEEVKQEYDTLLAREHAKFQAAQRIVRESQDTIEDLRAEIEYLRRNATETTPDVEQEK